MIDFTELINAQRKNRGIVGSRNRKVADIIDHRVNIEEAKAKVEEIISRGRNKRKHDKGDEHE